VLSCRLIKDLCKRIGNINKNVISIVLRKTWDYTGGGSMKLSSLIFLSMLSISKTVERLVFKKIKLNYKIVLRSWIRLCRIVYLTNFM